MKELSFVAFVTLICIVTLMLFLTSESLDFQIRTVYIFCKKLIVMLLLALEFFNKLIYDYLSIHNALHLNMWWQLEPEA